LENIDPTARDPASGRSQIRRFSLRSSSPQTWISGELLAYGIRNPAGFAFSPLSPTKLAIVENGASIDNVTGLTSAFVNDNPADELELVDLRRDKGASFGFPDCSTIWNGSADPSGVPQYVGFARGQQFSLHLEAGRDDAWCAVVANNRPPALSFQVRTVPWHELALACGLTSLLCSCRHIPCPWTSSSTSVVGAPKPTPTARSPAPS
jgi:hypothetical protein